MPSPTELKDAGLALFRQDKYVEAIAKFTEAAQRYEAQSDLAAAAEMRNNIGVMHIAEKNFEAALEAVVGTPDVFHAIGDKLREAQAISNIANILENLSRFDEAAKLYEQAIAMFTELNERENRAACWKALSNVQVKLDKKMQALASMQAGLNLSPNLSARERTLKGLIERAMGMIK
jgi:tetratricopeptide (TPR) repeat protein